MKILTLENNSYDIDSVPDEIDDIRYCVFDAGDPSLWTTILSIDFFRKFLCTCNMLRHRRI